MLVFLIAAVLAAGYDTAYFVRAVKRKETAAAAACIFLILVLAACALGIVSDL